MGWAYIASVGIYGKLGGRVANLAKSRLVREDTAIPLRRYFRRRNRKRQQPIRIEPGKGLEACNGHNPFIKVFGRVQLGLTGDLVT